MKPLFTTLFLYLLLANAGAQNVGINTTIPQTTLDVNGDFALRTGQLPLVAGTNNDINVAANRFAFYNLTGAGATFITGFAGGKDGRMITLFNSTNTPLTLVNNDAGSVAANRLFITTGNTLMLNKNENITLIYHTDLSRWIVTGTVGGNTWKQKGNSATDPDVDFIGTTDNQPVIFRMNNVNAGAIRTGSTFFGKSAGILNLTDNNNTGMGNNTLQLNVNGNYNSAVGSYALGNNTAGNYNTAVGVSALYVNQTGSYNTGIGSYSLSQNTGSYNTALGYRSLESNTNGINNTAAGYAALRVNNTGSYNSAFGMFALSNTNASGNTAVGHSALEYNTSGIQNTATGMGALAANTIGNSNTAMGAYALTVSKGYTNTAFGAYTLQSHKTNDLNTAIGAFALYRDTTGFNNVGLGYNALSSNITGGNNTALGADADVNFPGINNATAIGAGAKVSNANCMAFGSTSVTGWAFGRNAPGSGAALQVGTSAANGNGAWLSSGGVWTNASDSTKKDAITKLDGTAILSKIKQLPITRWKYKDTKEYHIGPMAQDFYALFEVGLNNTSISSIDPAGIALKAVQAQQEIIEAQNEKMAHQDKVIADLIKRLDKIETK